MKNLLNKILAVSALGLYVIVANFTPLKALAQSNCNAEFSLYHPNAPTGTKNLTVENLNAPVEMYVKIPASSLGFFPCGKHGRFLYSWNGGSDNFSLNQGSTEKRLNITGTIAKGKYTVKFQTSNASTASFSSVYYELTTSLTVGKPAQDGGGQGDGDDTDNDGDNNGDGSGGGSGDGTLDGEIGGEVDSSVQVTGGNFDEVIGTFSNPLEFDSVPELIVRLINIGLLIAAMIAVAVIIIGGFQMVTSSGNETRLTNGKKAVMWAIGGLIVCLLSFSIVAIIERVITR